jgi:NAD(P)-dependent dehydrogenase (short-subunit alcohol dehydrogenase family)
MEKFGVGNLHGKTALNTGAGSSTELATARAMAARGAHGMLSDLNEGSAQAGTAMAAGDAVRVEIKGIGALEATVEHER